MLVVLDSNAFHGDVHANRGLLRSILDDAVAEGDFELFIPEIVMQELDKHFAADTKKVVKEVNQATGNHRDELRRLNLEAPPRVAYDPASVDSYRPMLEARLKAAGAEILAIPEDLEPAVAWSVEPRKPFKEGGEGFPDAVIWLSIVELAAERKPEEIVFVSANAADFAKSKRRSSELSGDLAADLVNRGCAADQVRLVPGIGPFAAEIGVRLEPALERARELADAGSFEGGLEEHFLETRLEQGPLELGFDLDGDPAVDSVTVNSVVVEDASELPGKRLRLEARAELGLVLDLDIFRADFPLAEEEAPLLVVEVDFDQSDIEAQIDVIVNAPLVIVTDMDATEAQLEVGELSLAALERAHRALHGWRLEQLLAALSRDLVGRGVEEYVPDQAIESNIEEVTIQDVDEGSPSLVEVIKSDDSTVVCQLEVNLDADVLWVSTAPTPFDAERFASLTLNEESGAPILQDLDSRCPLTIDLTATWDAEERAWRDIDVNAVQLAPEKLKGRSERMTASEEEEMGGFLARMEELPDG
jgi:PIN domain